MLFHQLPKWVNEAYSHEKLQENYKAHALELSHSRGEGAGGINALIRITHCLQTGGGEKVNSWYFQPALWRRLGVVVGAIVQPSGKTHRHITG